MITARLFLPFTLAFIGAVVGISGCAREYSGGEGMAEVDMLYTRPIVLPSPTPTPTPDPLQKFRRAHEIPSWSHSQIVKQVSVKPDDKPIALTFDDGPWPEHTQQILNILAEHRTKATFYMLGSMVQEYPQIALKVRDAGHAIGGHSWSHASRPKDAVSEITSCNAQFQKVLGFTPTTFRPPYGFLKNGMADQAMREKQAVVLWSADSNDWKKPSVSQMTATILREATPGGIVLFHDGGGARHSTVKALPTILRELKARGYRFVTVPELLRLRHVPAPPAEPQQAPPAVTAKARANSSNAKSSTPNPA